MGVRSGPESRFGYKTEADIREVAQPAANTAQLNDTALTFWRFAPDGQPAPYRMYTDDGVTTDHNKPEHWRICLLYTSDAADE